MTDEDQVRRMIALWSEADGNKDPAAFAALFTEDGKYVSRRGESVGRAAIYKNLADRISLSPPDRETMHLFGEPVVEVTGDTAHARSPYVGYGRIGDAPWEIMSVGRFHTWLVRQGGKWLFTEVENRSIGKAGGPATILHHPHV
jgi:ketosteroid isomerase-like protein